MALGRPVPTPLGPNVRCLLSERLAQLLVEDGVTRIPIADVLASYNTKLGFQRFTKKMEEARKWTQMALASVKLAAEPNEWKDKADEEIAGELLRQIKAKRDFQRTSSSDGVPIS